MGVPISIRLDEEVRTELETQARARGVGLATLLRDLATNAAREARRARIREASAVIGALVATSAEAEAVYEGWGTPRAMPAESVPLLLRAGQIVLADWRGDALPKESNKRRPAAVVENDGLFAPSYPNAILVPLSEDAALAIPHLSVAIAPTAENGCRKHYWAVSHLVATTSKSRLCATPSRVTPDQLAAIRRQIALAVGVEC